MAKPVPKGGKAKAKPAASKSRHAQARVAQKVAAAKPEAPKKTPVPKAKASVVQRIKALGPTAVAKVQGLTWQEADRITKEIMAKNKAVPVSPKMLEDAPKPKVKQTKNTVKEHPKKTAKPDPEKTKEQSPAGGASRPSALKRPQALADGMSTPPTKRVTFKSPVASEAESCSGSSAARQKRELRHAVAAAEVTAEVDGGSMGEFLEEMHAANGEVHPALVQAHLRKQEVEAETLDEGQEDMEEEEPEEDEVVEEEFEEEAEGEEECEEEDEEDEKVEGEVQEKKETQGQGGAEPVSALAAAAQASQGQSEDLKRNSVTMKAEWEKYVRCAKSGKLPQSLCSMFRSQKQKLFGLWLDAEMDWDSVQMKVEQSKETEQLKRSEMEAVQVKVLKKRLGDKFNDLYRVRLEQGLWYNDSDFPADEQERWVYMPLGKRLRNDERLREKQSLTMCTSRDGQGGKDMLKAMTEESAPFAPNQLLAATAASESGSKLLLQSLTDEAVAIKKAPRKPKVEKTKDEEPLAAKTWLQPGAQSRRSIRAIP